MQLSNERLVSLLFALAAAAGGSGILVTESDKRAACGEVLMQVTESYAVALQQERERK
ncbi:MAG: hypothetical protein V3V08_23580 [Nannocystaceae bacterium]